MPAVRQKVGIAKLYTVVGVTTLNWFRLTTLCRDLPKSVAIIRREDDNAVFAP